MIEETYADIFKQLVDIYEKRNLYRPHHPGKMIAGIGFCSYLKEYRTFGINTARQCGKTSALNAFMKYLEEMNRNVIKAVHKEGMMTSEERDNINVVGINASVRYKFGKVEVILIDEPGKQSQVDSFIARLHSKRLISPHAVIIIVGTRFA